MTTAPPIRWLALTVVVITVALGTFYLLGRLVTHSLGNEPAPAPSASVAPRPAAGTGSAPTEPGDQPSRATGRPSQSAVPQPRGSASRSAGSARPDRPDPENSTSPGPDPTRAAVDPGDDAQHAAAERPRLPLQQDGGPYGSRSTTGSSHQVALTFDDGPDPDWTPQILALLRQHQVRATFCLVGSNVARFPELVRAIAADGHTLCNHTWSHDLSLGQRSRARIAADLTRTNEALRDAVPDARIAYFRQPGGNWSPTVVAVAQELGMTSLHWAVDPQDWRRPGAGSISARVTGRVFGGAIVLLHDAGGDRRQTISALRTILPNLARRFALAPLPNGVDPPRREALAPGTRPG